MATAVKAASAGMTGAVRSLQWTIQDMNGSVEHLGQSHDHLRRAQNIMAWTTAIFGALLLSGLVWIANDIFHLKDQLMESDRRFDVMETQMTALGSRLEDVNISIEQLSAELLVARGSTLPSNGQANGNDVAILSTPNTPESFQTAASAPLDVTVTDAAAQPLLQQPAQVQAQQVAPAQQQLAPAPQQQVAAVAPAQPAVQVIQPATAPAQVAVIPSPRAPREQLTPQELAVPGPVLAAVVPAAPAPAPAAPAPAPAPAAAAPAPAAPAPAVAPAAEQAAPAPAAEVAAAAPAAAPAPAAAAPTPAGNLSDDQILSFNDDQIDPADELLLLDENGNPQ